MPKRGLFSRKESLIRNHRFHAGLYSAMVKQSKSDNVTITELINYTLAARFCPELIQELDKWKNTSRYKFPTRIQPKRKK